MGSCLARYDVTKLSVICPYGDHQIMKYHAHIYFESAEISEAKVLLAEANALGNGIHAAGVASKPVGPHPLPMIELHFTDREVAGVVSWLEARSPGRSVLIHEDTGDDYKDHTSGARWLGQSLALDFSFFDAIQRGEKKPLH